MSLQDWLCGGPLLTDGAWGTELQSRGLDPGACPDAWNLEEPERVKSVARAYREAGSRIILTNTFRSNRISLAGHGLAGLADKLNRAGVSISRAAGDGLVFASIGPTGKMIMTGEVTEEEVFQAFAEQAKACAEAGADALLLETMTDLEEARIALRAALPTGLPVVVSFVFDSGKNKDRTMMGATPEQVAKAISTEGASAVGANCGVGIEAFLPVCRRIRASTDLPVWIKANAGLPVTVDGKVAYITSPDEFASHAGALLEAGASFLGGCCGTNPDFIRALARVLHPCA
jgi:5-methyltetrahydrofolate--homocysteine methyltransferase